MKKVIGIILVSVTLVTSIEAYANSSSKPIEKEENPIVRGSGRRTWKVY